MAILCCRCRRLDAILSSPIRNKTLQLTDGYRFALNATDTFTFTLTLLRTYAATDCRKCAGLGDNLVSPLKIASLYFCDEIRNIDVYRTALNSHCIFAVQATLSLCHRFFFIIAKTYFVKICRSYLRILLSYRNLL